MKALEGRSLAPGLRLRKRAEIERSTVDRFPRSLALWEPPPREVVDLWEGWRELDSDRPILVAGMGTPVYRRIPRRDLRDWLDRNGYAGEERQDAERILRYLDDTYLELRSLADQDQLDEDLPDPETEIVEARMSAAFAELEAEREAERESESD